MCCYFYRFGNSASKAACCSGMLCEDLSADLCCHGRRRRYVCAVGAHYFSAERLLLIADLYHKDLAVQSEIGARHRKRRSPLTCSCFGRHALQALLFGIVCLRNGRIQLMAAAGIIALEFIIDLRRRVQRFFQTICTNKR